MLVDEGINQPALVMYVESVKADSIARGNILLVLQWEIIPRTHRVVPNHMALQFETYCRDVVTREPSPALPRCRPWPNCRIISATWATGRGQLLPWCTTKSKVSGKLNPGGILGPMSRFDVLLPMRSARRLRLMLWNLGQSIPVWGCWWSLRMSTVGIGWYACLLQSLHLQYLQIRQCTTPLHSWIGYCLQFVCSISFLV